MSAAILPSEAQGIAAVLPRLERGDGAAEIAFMRRGATSVLAHLSQRTPCRVLFPAVEATEPPLAALITTSGGIAGGDRLSWSVAVGAGAAATVTTAAAEKVYRSTGPAARIETALSVGPGGWLEWLPQETILFEGSRVERRIAAEIASTGRLLAAEMLVFGRRARGEALRTGLLRESWRLRRDGRLVWADALRLDHDIPARLDAAAGFGGAEAVATAAYLGADAERHLPLARALVMAAPCRAGATLVNGILLSRLLGPAAALRRALAQLIAGLREAAAGLAPALPRLWHV
jgi:urease accessory protein